MSADAVHRDDASPGWTRSLLDQTNDAADLRTAAITYVSDLGLAVFPLKPGRKEPLTAHGLTDASRHPATIKAWWRRWPDANLGWPIPSGLVVLDIDDLDAGRRLEDEHGPLDSPVAIRTGRGVQLLFRTEREFRNRVGLFGGGVDLRGSGGYVLLPPSVHPTGAIYTWLDLSIEPVGAVQPAPLPRWLEAALTSRSAARTSSFPVRLPVTSGERFAEGTRNDGLARVAGGLRRRGFDEATILEALDEANQRQCAPPLPDREVERIARSISRYEPAPMQRGRSSVWGAR